MTRSNHSTLEVVRRRSRQLLIETQHDSGALPAATEFSVYRDYCWFRDGAFIADALSQIGEVAAASAFHRWCAAVIDVRAERIASLVDKKLSGLPISTHEYLPTRYTLTGEESSEEWWNFQLDGYGTWLLVLEAHLTRHGLDAREFSSSVETTVRYLDAFGDLACFDWWEEFEQERHLSTLGAIAAGLGAASRLLDGSGATVAEIASNRIGDVIDAASSRLGYLPKWLGSEEVDGSLLCCLTHFRTVAAGGRVAEATYEKVVSDLVAEGVFRYRGDTFFGGGEWILLTAWLGLYEVKTGRIELAQSRLDWILDQANSNGDLPEQVDVRCQFPGRVKEWQDRWGPVATPLLWSHAMFIQLDTALANTASTPATARTESL